MNNFLAILALVLLLDWLDTVYVEFKITLRKYIRSRRDHYSPINYKEGL